jgi:hypothetical protein
MFSLWEYPCAFREVPQGSVMSGFLGGRSLTDPNRPHPLQRRTVGEYNFTGQYQQTPAPLGGGLVKAKWFKRYLGNELPERFDRIVQSWDTANKATELSDFSVCTTWVCACSRMILSPSGLYRVTASHPSSISSWISCVPEALSSISTTSALNKALLLAHGAFERRVFEPPT